MCRFNEISISEKYWAKLISATSAASVDLLQATSLAQRFADPMTRVQGVYSACCSTSKMVRLKHASKVMFALRGQPGTGLDTLAAEVKTLSELFCQV